jgi:hypothetical protein
MKFIFNNAGVKVLLNPDPHSMKGPSAKMHFKSPPSRQSAAFIMNEVTFST